jgi:hypothetical protein
MTKYQNYAKKASPLRSKEPHPVWRGIGCFIMLLVPALSLGISYILIELALEQGIQLPPELLGRPLMPPILFRVPGLVGILNWIQSLNNLYAILVGTLTVTVVLGGLLGFAYAFVYRLIGPSPYTDMDARPQNIKVRKYKR